MPGDKLKTGVRRGTSWRHVHDDDDGLDNAKFCTRLDTVIFGEY